jgi:hypothetical protein
MKYPAGSLLFDSYQNTYLIVVDENYNRDDEEGVFVNYAMPFVKDWDSNGIRLTEIISRLLLKWNGTRVFCHTMLTPEEFDYCERIA